MRTRQPALVAHGLVRKYPTTRRRTATVWRRRPPKEADFMAQVIVLARMYGWEHHHDHDSRKSTPGWPDLELVRGQRHIRAECKVHERDRELKGDQLRIMSLLRQVPGLETYVWLPVDLPQIAAILRRRTA